MNPQPSRRRAAFAALFLSLIASAHAQPPGTTDAGVVDLAPGQDVYVPRQLAVNPATDRLYVGGYSFLGQNQGIKVIDTASKQVIAGVDLGRYANALNSFSQFAMAVDSSPAPLGNKIYVLGQLDYPHCVLRVVDGETNQNLTGEGSDLLLPWISRQDQDTPAGASQIVVNPNNHKVYIADGFGKVIVVDGSASPPKVLTTLNLDAGSFLLLSPTSNKVFVMGYTAAGESKPGAVIDSATDTFTYINTAMYVFGGAFNPADNRLYFAGQVNRRNGIFVLDGSTGELVIENTQNPPFGASVAISPSRNALFVGGKEYAADTLTFRREIAKETPGVVIDVQGGDDLFFLYSYGQARAAIVAMNLASLERTQITTGSRPLGMAANSRTDRVYVADTYASELVVLQASSGTIAARVPLELVASTSSDSFATQPRSVAVSERLNRIYVPRYGTSSPGPILDVLDGTTNQVRSSIIVPGAQPDSPIAIDDTRRRIYIGIIEPASAPFVRYPYGRMAVAVYDADSETLVQTLYLSEPVAWPGIPNVAVNPVLGRLYAGHPGSVTTIDTTTNLVVASQALPRSSSLAVNKRSGKVFVSFMRSTSSSPQASDTRLAVLNGLTGVLETEFAPPEGDYFGVRSLVVDEVSNRLYALQTTPAPNDNESTRDRITAYDGNSYELLGEHNGVDARNMVFDPGSRRFFVAVTNGGTIDVFQSTTAGEPDLLGNISTRGSVGAGDNALIGGFIITGAPGATKRVAVRALGPSLGAAGVAGAVSDTTLELHDAAGNILLNDDWKVDPATNASQEAEVTASGLAPASDRESTLIAALPPGPCTVVVRGKNGATGVALVEVYDLDQGAGTKMANIATRGTVGTGENVMIGGFIVRGSTASRVLVRAIAPSLTTVAGALRDPVLELRDVNGGLIDVSDDWKTGRESEIADTTIPPVDDRESALVTTLHPGNYTAIVRGKDETTGVALVEAYHLP